MGDGPIRIKRKTKEHRNGEKEERQEMSTEKTPSPFIEEYRALVAAVEAFDHRDVDITTLTDQEIYEIERSRLKLYSLHERAYEERLRRIEIRRQEQQKEQDRRRERYGYYFKEHNRKPGVGGGENEITDWDLIQVGAYEEAVVKMSYVKDPETAVDEIKKCIPGITDEEIEQYRNGENPLTD